MSEELQGESGESGRNSQGVSVKLEERAEAR